MYITNTHRQYYLKKSFDNEWDPCILIRWCHIWLAIGCICCHTGSHISDLTNGLISTRSLIDSIMSYGFPVSVDTKIVVCIFEQDTHTLFDFYQKTESYLKKPKIAIPLILLLIINWIWNITKGLWYILNNLDTSPENTKQKRLQAVTWCP